MSKKSRKRNKKILGILAAGLGAAALMKRRKLANATDTVNPVGGVDQMAADAASKAPVTSINKPTAPVEKAAVDSAPDTGFQTKYTKKVDGKWMGPMEYKNYMASTAGNRVPPSMRGGADVAEGYQRKYVTNRTGRGKSGITYGYSGQPLKKGGRVTGAAKRGFGRALMKGKK